MPHSRAAHASTPSHIALLDSVKNAEKSARAARYFAVFMIVLGAAIALASILRVVLSSNSELDVRLGDLGGGLFILFVGIAFLVRGIFKPLMFYAAFVALVAGIVLVIAL